MSNSNSDSDKAKFIAEYVPLVQKAQKGNQEALALLITVTKDRFYGFCFYLTGNSYLANDLLQDAMIKVIEKLPTLKDPKSYYAWLCRMAKNHYLNLMRSEGYRNHENIDDTQEGHLEDKASGSLDQSQMVRRVLAQLSESERTVLLLVDLEGQSYEEAAEIIGISLAALKSRLIRARQVFIEKMQKK